MPFALRRGPAPALRLERTSYRPGDAVRVTVSVPDLAQCGRGHVRLRCHLPPDAALDPLVDPLEFAGCEPECVEIARAELAPSPSEPERLIATVHLPADAQPTCRGEREVAAWEVVAVVGRRAANAWLEVLPPGA